MSEFKTFRISGAAVKDMNGGLRKKGGRRTIKREQHGGSDDDIRGTENIRSIATTSGSTSPDTWLKMPTNVGVQPVINIQPSYTPPSPNQSSAPTEQYTVQEGGTKNIRVELKKKASSKRVHLNPKKVDNPKSHIHKKSVTRKARKVSVGVASLHRRMTHAKKVHKKVKDMPLDKLKEHLISRGLIKATSKAPESVLRQIATDAEVVAKKAL
jgi:hypothetical protein